MIRLNHFEIARELQNIYPIPRKLAAHHLLELMKELSEANYAAGWMTGLEYELWEARELGIRNGFTKSDRLNISKDNCLALLILSILAGRWIVWDTDKGEPELVGITEWYEQFKSWRASQ